MIGVVFFDFSVYNKNVIKKHKTSNKSVKECVYGWAMPGYYSGNQDLIVIQHPGLNGSSTKTWGGAPFYKPSILIAGRNDLHFQSSYGVKGLQGELVDLSKPVDKKGWRKARNRGELCFRPACIERFPIFFCLPVQCRFFRFLLLLLRLIRGRI